MVRQRHPVGGVTRTTHTMDPVDWASPDPKYGAGGGSQSDPASPATGANQLYGTGQVAIDPIDGRLVTPGSLPGGALVDADVGIAKFASSIRPVAIVSSLPTLPDTLYPILSYAVLSTDSRLYKNIADVWVKGVDGSDIVADSITAGQIAAGAVSTSELAVGAKLVGSVDNKSVGPNVQISATGIQITEGALSFVDTLGTTALDGNGFGSAWRRYIQSGLYNAGFESAPPTPASNLSSVNVPPFWSYGAVGSSITAKSVVRNGERVIEFTAVSGNNGDECYLEQIIPIAYSSGALTISGIAAVVSDDHSGTVSGLRYSAGYAFLDSSFAVLSSLAAFPVLHPLGYVADSTYAQSWAAGVAPTTAVYLRVRVRAYRDVTNTNTLVSRFHEIRLYDTGERILVADSDDPTIQSSIENLSGKLYIRGRATGSYPSVRLEADGANNTGFLVLNGPYGTQVIGDFFVSGQPNGSTGYLPYAYWAGTVTVTLTAAASGFSSVTFPTGRFTVAPIVSLTQASLPGGSGKLIAKVNGSTLTATNCDVYLYTGDGTTTTATSVTVNVVAVQMTSSTAAG